MNAVQKGDGGTVFWAASKAVWSAGRERWFSPSALVRLPEVLNPALGPSIKARPARKVQTRTTEMIIVLGSLSYGNSLRQLGCSNRREGSGVTFSTSGSWSVWKRMGEGISERICTERTRDDVFKWKDNRFRLDIRRKVLTVRMVRHWHRLPIEFVDGPSLELFEARLDGGLSNLV